MGSRQAETAALRKRLDRIDATEDAHIREAAALADLDANSPAVKAMRDRHLKRFTELEAEKDQIKAKLAALAKQASSHGGDPALLDALPILGDVLDRLPRHLKTKIFDAFDLQAIYTKTTSQVTLRATITTTTPATVRAIIATSETPDLAKLLATWAPPSDLAREPLTTPGP